MRLSLGASIFEDYFGKFMALWPHFNKVSFLLFLCLFNSWFMTSILQTLWKLTDMHSVAWHARHFAKWTRLECTYCMPLIFFLCVADSWSENQLPMLSYARQQLWLFSSRVWRCVWSFRPSINAVSLHNTRKSLKWSFSQISSRRCYWLDICNHIERSKPGELS